MCVCELFFFFSSRRRHTRLTCDWSSDVCSSDLLKVDLGRVRGLSRMTIEVSRPSKKQSPPVRGIGSEMPPILSQQLPRDSMRSEERRVGKECRSRWWSSDERKKASRRMCELRRT